MSDNQNEEKNKINEYEDRKRKLAELREAGVQPFAERFERTHSIFEAREAGENEQPRELEMILGNPKAEMRIAGRLVLMRPHGKLTFAKLKDFSGEIQVCFMKDFTGEEAYKMLKKVDIGDFVGVRGELFVTKHGELTLLVQEYKLLSKTLRPLPEKFHGLKDQEAKYRYRYLDMLSDAESYKKFLFRTRLITAIRRYMDEHGFIEIETPIFHPIASGAAAKPFVTHHNALDFDVYLRIAPETYLKRAIVGGFDRVYEIAKCFRNEGMDPSHLQEFTMLEYYASYWNFEDNMKFTEQFLSTVIKETSGDLKVELMDRDGNKELIDFTPPWPRLNFVELIEKDCGINILDFYGDADGLRKAILSTIDLKGVDTPLRSNDDGADAPVANLKGADAPLRLELKALVAEKTFKNMGYGNLCDALYKKVSRPKLIQPCFVIKHPVDTKPLARRNDEDERLADTFQVLVNTWEIVNAYGELVDPLDQRDRLTRQADAREGGDEEAMMMDEDYLYSMEHGMPPMSGWGLGIDRFVALLTNQENLKDTVLFPLMKPENHFKDKLTGVGLEEKTDKKEESE